jgi:membrane protein YdbS with pleckstrin-like domain
MRSTSPSEPQAPSPAPAKASTEPPAAGDLAAVLGEERELWRGRMSWKRQAGHLVVWAVAAIVLVWVWTYFRQPGSGPWLGRIILLLILGSGAGVFVHSALVVYRIRYRLTTQRLFVDQGILGRTTDQTELYRVDDVRTHQGLFDRIFGVGDVELVAPSESTQPSLRLVGIADPAVVAEHVRTHSRALRMKRSLFVEQM